MILQRARHVTKSREIQRRIDQRLDAWEAGEHTMLVEDKFRTCDQYLSTSRGGDSPDRRDKIYRSLVIWGKLRLAVQWITDREKGGVLQLEDTCLNKGMSILDVLHLK